MSGKSIIIQTEKILLENGLFDRKIVFLDGLRYGELPADYLKSPPHCFSRRAEGKGYGSLEVDNGGKNIVHLEIDMVISEYRFQELLFWIRKAAIHLRRIRRKKDHVPEVFRVNEVFII